MARRKSGPATFIRQKSMHSKIIILKYYINRLVSGQRDAATHKCEIFPQWAVALSRCSQILNYCWCFCCPEGNKEKHNTPKKSWVTNKEAAETERWALETIALQHLKENLSALHGSKIHQAAVGAHVMTDTIQHRNNSLFIIKILSSQET